MFCIATAASKSYVTYLTHNMFNFLIRNEFIFICSVVLVDTAITWHNFYSFNTYTDLFL